MKRFPYPKTHTPLPCLKRGGLNLILSGSLLALLSATAGQAADVFLTASDSSGTSTSFNSAGNWGNLSAPSSGNAYFTGAFNIYTPNDTADHAFAGASLTVESGGKLIYGGGKDVNTITVNSLIVDGGTIQNSGTNSTTNMRLAGSINVTANGGTFNTGNFFLGSTITAAVSGSGTLVLTGGSSSGRIAFTSASNTFTGDLSLTNSATLTFGTTSHWTFSIGADGVNNSIYGTGTQVANLNGVFDFDMSGADTAPGNSWTIVDLGSVSATFDPTNFMVAGFTESTPGLWTFGGYQFDESTGVLSVVAIPEPSTYAAMAGLLTLAAVVCNRGRRGRSV